jgi:DNA ligase-associated metallophosphoesterase
MVPVSFAPFAFAGQEWAFADARALYWPREQTLLVADLHLEKASFFASHGQMLPPYDSRETLERLACAIRATGARRVFCLGDNFHDSAGIDRMEPHAAGMLAALTRATDWVWVTGNHDPALDAALAGPPGRNAAPLVGGTVVDEMSVGGVILRHRAQAGETAPELSGHFHPRLRVALKGRRIARPCLVIANDGDQSGSTGRMILPAFGSLTGGMDAGAPEILDAMQPAAAIDALLPTANRLARFPLWRRAA